MTETVTGPSAGDESRPPIILVLHSTPEGLGVQKQVSAKNPVMTQLYGDDAPLRIRITEEMVGRHYIYPHEEGAHLQLMEGLDLSPRGLRTGFKDPSWFAGILADRLMSAARTATRNRLRLDDIEAIVIEQTMIQSNSLLTQELLNGVFNNALFYSFQHASNIPQQIWSQHERTGDGIIPPRCRNCGGKTRFTGRFDICNNCGESSAAK